MNVTEHSEVERLVRDLVLPFYHIKRDIRLPIGEPRFENDAEHSWSLAVIACCFAPLIDSKLDVGRVCQLATAHDMVEVFAGDTSVFSGPVYIASKVDREHEALDVIKRDFSRFPWLYTMINEYKTRKSNEAKFVYALDKYVTVLFDYLDEGKYLRDLKMSHKEYTQHLSEHRQKAHQHSAVGSYYDKVRELLDAHPEYFYTESQ